MKKLFSLAAILILTLAINTSCNNTTDDPDFSDSFVTVESIEPQPFCSIPTDVDGVYWDDNATFTLANDPKDLDILTTHFQDVVISQYTISYQYTNPLGSTAPPFTEYLNAKIVGGQTTQFDAVVVRATDKIAGYFVSGIDAIATITFYGKDTSGEDVEATANFTINFRDVCATEVDDGG